MAMIEMSQLNATFGDGVPARISAPGQTADNETHVYFESCEDAKAVTLADSRVEGTGRTLDVCMTLCNVCPGRRAAVGIAISEVDNAGNEYQRGFRAITVPAHNNAACCDIAMPVTRFILPDDVRVDGGAGLCNGRRHFVIRATCHYADTSAN